MRAAKMSAVAACRMRFLTSSRVMRAPTSRAASSASANTCTRSSTPHCSRCSPADQPAIGLLFQFVMKPRAGSIVAGICAAGNRAAPFHAASAVER
jgi:hypothetical protein